METLWSLKKNCLSSIPHLIQVVFFSLAVSIRNEQLGWFLRDPLTLNTIFSNLGPVAFNSTLLQGALWMWSCGSLSSL